MKNTFRQSMAWLHTWAGLVVGWVLYFIFLTGTLGYFDTEIDRWMRPEQPLVSNHPSLENAVALGLGRLEQVAPRAERWFVNPPIGREYTGLRIYYQHEPDAQGRRGARGSELLDSVTGEPLQYRDTGGGQVLYRMHWELHYLPGDAAIWIVGVCTLFMLVAIVSGVIIHKKIFRDFFTFRPRKQQRSWLDAHNVLSVVALPFHLMITYSGLVFFVTTYMALVVAANYGAGGKNEQIFSNEFLARPAELEPAGVDAPLTSLTPILAEAAQRWGPQAIRFVDIRNRGDANARITVGRRLTTPQESEELVFDGVSGQLLQAEQPLASGPRDVRDVFLNLHEGLFAGPLLRWLYFLSGLLGTAMIGTGLVLWTAKRSVKQAKVSFPRFSVTLIERLNVGTIIGLPIGVAAYFWANRLIPADFSNRAQWEVHAMFIAWALMLVHACSRPRAVVSREQMSIAAAACVLLPLLNVLTTDRHLGVTLPGGDWALAGIDLTLLVTGLAFGAAAFRLYGRGRADVSASSERSAAVQAAAAENG